MRFLFYLLRASSGLASLAALGILVLLILLQSAGAFLKESAGVVKSVAVLFTSGFTKSTHLDQPSGWNVHSHQAALVILFGAMLISIFMPGTKLFLHALAVLAGAAIVWCLWTRAFWYLPSIAVWFSYYAACIYWTGRTLVAQP